MPNTDWNLIVQGNISLIWCQWANDPRNRDKTVGQLLAEFHQRYTVAPLNIGSLLMASYILFVYPQQAEFENADFARIDTSKFIVSKGTPNTEHKRFCSRIRNGLTHGRFTVNGEQIELCDQKNDGSDPFCTTISVGDFGQFISAFMLEMKNQHFDRR